MNKIPRIMNEPDNIVDEMLEGFLKAHADLVEKTENKRVVKAKNIPSRQGRCGHRRRFGSQAGFYRLCRRKLVRCCCRWRDLLIAYRSRLSGQLYGCPDPQGKGVACLYGNRVTQVDNMNVKMAVKMASRSGYHSQDRRCQRRRLSIATHLPQGST